MYGGNFVSQNRLGQLVAGRKFTLFALFYFVFEGKFQVQAPRRAYVRRGYLTEGFLRYDYGGFIFGGDYTWRGLFSEFYGIIITIIIHFIIKMIKMIIIVIVVLIIIKIIIIITFCSSSGGTHQIYVTACSRVDISSYSTEVCLCENQQDCRCKQRD